MENEHLWREVGLQLDVPHSMINRLQNRHQPTGSTAKRQRPDRPRWTTLREKRLMQWLTYSLINIYENCILNSNGFSLTFKKIKFRKK